MIHCLHMLSLLPAGPWRCLQAANKCISAFCVCWHRHAVDWHGGGDHGLCCLGLPLSCKPWRSHDCYAVALCVHGRLWWLLLGTPVQVVQGILQHCHNHHCLCGSSCYHCSCSLMYQHWQSPSQSLAFQICTLDTCPCSTTSTLLMCYAHIGSSMVAAQT